MEQLSLPETRAVRTAQQLVRYQAREGVHTYDRLKDFLADNPIRDALVRQGYFTFVPHGRTAVSIQHPEVPAGMGIHIHALRQIAQRVKLPWSYVRLLQNQSQPWGAELLAHNLNTLYRELAFGRKAQTVNFLVRYVGDQVRGFLSQQYAVHLSTNPLLLDFLDYCAAHKAFPTAALLTDVRVNVKCLLPEVFEPIPQQPICLGVSFQNSDFGAGIFSVSRALWDPLTGISLMFSDAGWEPEKSKLHQRVHRSRILHSAEDILPEGSRQARTRAVSDLLHEEIGDAFIASRIQRTLDAVKYAHSKQISWHNLRRSFVQKLHDEELEQLEAMLKTQGPALPQLLKEDAHGWPVPTAWWAAKAFATLAKDISATDPDRALDLQHFAGTFLQKGNLTETAG